jgi:NitT/TauT family transport system substrate-binding protein
MRTAAGTQAALGGLYPATSLYMTTSYVNSHPQTVQKLANAFVETLQWIQTHTPTEITAMMPASYYAGIGKAAYVSALQNEKGMYDPNGLMPASGPQTVLQVQNAFNPDVAGHQINLSETYTNSFVQAALAAHI